MACATSAIDTTSSASVTSSVAQASTAAASTTASTRTTRFSMEGVGARVIRGPDWKWGKQVI